jgi:hypothetical protein
MRQLTLRIADQSEKNAELSRRIAGLADGGDSFAYVSFARGQANDAQRYLVVVQQGEFPLYDLNVRIVDLIEFRKTQIHSLETLAKNVINVGNLPVGGTAPFPNVRFDVASEGQAYNIFFQARNGYWIQNVTFSKAEDGKYEYKNKVTRMRDAQQVVIFEE